MLSLAELKYAPFFKSNRYIVLGCSAAYFQNLGDKLNFRIFTDIDANNGVLKNSHFMRFFRGVRYGLDVQMWDIRQLSTMNT